ncbi:autophagy-related protein 9A [Octopus sinensis]|nr:autophagy-related protein 9A [Octopus sinensis]
MTTYETGYQALGSFPEDDNDDESSPAIQILPEGGGNSWNHIQNLDDFFTRIYNYHQKNGYKCMVLDSFLQLLSIFILGSLLLCLHFVNYQLLFNYQHTGPKLTIPDLMISFHLWSSYFNFWLVALVILFVIVFLANVFKFLYNILKSLETRRFFIEALKIPSAELGNYTWHDVLCRLLEVQKEQQMCIHKQELTELDIYHRILRFKNYMIAMINKSLLPLRFRLPFVGECVFLSTALKTNIEIILFYSPWAPFDHWHLKSEYKNIHKRKDLAKRLSRQILWMAIGNFVLCPIIFGLQIMYTFFRYTELVKRDPGQLGLRRWSNYARLYLRHFNELDHEFQVRLSRGYKPAVAYMSIFTSPMFVLFAKYGSLLCGAFFAVLFALTLCDSDILDVEYVLGLLTFFGFLTATLHSMIPPEHEVYNPEVLMRAILSQIHYMPDNWKCNAHTNWVRDEFAQLFQYRFVYLIEELLSPIVTPIILFFWIRPKSLEIVDFMRNFTVDVVGVGDVCSFAQMDVKKHGNTQLLNTVKKVERTHYQQAEDSKTELSLIHFRMTNPGWKIPENGNSFLTGFREQAIRDIASLSMTPLDNPPLNPFHYLAGTGISKDSVLGGLGYYSSFGLNSIPSGQPGQSLDPLPGQGTGPQLAFPPGSQSGYSPGPQSGFPPGPQSGFSPGPQSGFSPGPHAGFSPGLQSGFSLGPLSGFSPGLQPALSVGYPSHLGNASLSINSLRARVKGAVASCEGPLFPWSSNVTGFASSGVNSDTSVVPHLQTNGLEQGLEVASVEMGLSALYIHDLNHRQSIRGIDNVDEAQSRRIWQSSPEEMRAFMTDQEINKQNEEISKQNSQSKPL